MSDILTSSLRWEFELFWQELSFSTLQDERRPTVNELANQKFVLQKINGWKIYHLSAGMEDIVDMENELSDKLEDFAQRIEDAASKIRTFSIIF